MASLTDKVMPQGPQFLDFVADSEPWAQYRLEDGTVIRVRVMLVKCINRNEYGEDGYPIYQMQFSQVLDVTWPDHVKAEAERRTRERQG